MAATVHTSPGKAAARRAKAHRLAGVLDGVGCTADDLDALTDVGWSLAEQAAGTRPASAETREVVRAILSGMAAERERTADPFASFPKL